jgi:lipopolysaccharide export system permease protein
MIFKRTLQSELIFYSTAVYAALTLITLTFTLIRLLTQAVDGRIDPQTVFVLLGFALVNYQAIVLSLSVFIGTLLVFSRMWRDSEMTIWQASGLSLRSFVWPTLRFAIPIALLAALFSMMIAPWANKQAYEYRDSYEKRGDLSRIATQQFKENRDSSRIFYVGNVDENTQAASNLFIVERNPKSPQFESIVAAQQGRIQTAADGDRYLELQQGRRYQLPKLQAEPSTPTAGKTLQIGLMRFEQYQVLLAESPAKVSTTIPYKQQNTLALMGNNDKLSRGELLWRIGTPLMGVLLALLAVPLSYFNPRSGKSAPLVIAVLLFIVYMNGLNITQNYLQSGKLKPLVALLSPHLAIFSLAMVLLLWRSQWFSQVLGRLRRGLSPSNVTKA